MRVQRSRLVLLSFVMSGTERQSWGYQRGWFMASRQWRDSILPQDSSLATALETLDATGLQIVIVLDADGRLRGTLTDGDVRRALLRGVALDSRVSEHMNLDPISVAVGTESGAVLDLLRRMVIKSVPVIDEHRRVVNLITLDELISPRKRNTPAVIMAGGRGARLRPLTDSIPKPLVRIAGEPLIDILTRRLVAHGFSDIWVTVHYRATEIQEHLGNGGHFGAEIKYITERKPLGTAGAIRDVAVAADETPILVCNVDTVHALDFGAVVDHHTSVGAWATLAVTEHVTEVPYGVVSIDEGMVVDVVEKPRRSDWVAAGVSVLTHQAFSFFAPGTRIDVPEVVTELLARGLPIAAFEDPGYWIDVGTHDALDKARTDHDGRPSP